VLSFKSVKLRLAEGATLGVVLPVVSGNSMVGCSSATSTGGGGFSCATSTSPELVGVMLMATWFGVAAFSARVKLIGWS
jgi:hypothetical protein